MRKLTNLFILLAIAMCINAQDVIVKKDGSTILSKVLEVNKTDIKYKKYSNQNGPIYTVDKSEIMAINYENGDKDDFSAYVIENKKSDMETKGYYKSSPSINNESIIASYNINHSSLLINKGKKSKGCFVILGVGDNSILSDDNVEIELSHYDYSALGFENIFKYRRCQECDFEIIIKNKTDRTIYVDLGNTFRILNDKSYVPFYNGEQTTISSGGSSGVSLNLGSIASIAGLGGAIETVAGGVSVGGSSNRGFSQTFSKQRILSVPPKSSASLGKCSWKHPNGRGNIRMSSAESLSLSNMSLVKKYLKAGESYIYDYSISPFYRKYLLTYSTLMDFSNYTTLNVDLYLREIIATDKSFSHRTEKLERTFIEEIGAWNSKTICTYCLF